MIEVLRLGHRIPRDERISTHCALVGRAFGADGLWYSGMKDKGFENSVSGVVDDFGGEFFIEYVSDDLKFVKKKKEEGWFVVHLTMYGVGFEKKVGEVKKVIDSGRDVVIVVGGEKVEPEFYEISDLNLAVGNQPHSEVGALAVFLYEVCGLKKKFDGARIVVEECERGKRVVRVERMRD